VQTLSENLRVAHAPFEKEFFENCSEVGELQSTTFSLCFFNAVVVQSRKCGPQGWTGKYPVNEGDLHRSAQANYLEANPSNTMNSYTKQSISYVEMPMPGETPVAFGLHPNAQIGTATEVPPAPRLVCIESNPGPLEKIGPAKAPKRGRKCPHYRERSKCEQCGGGVRKCPHNKQRSKCKECGGSSLCPHYRERSKCTQCGGGNRKCPHNKQRSRCKECVKGEKTRSYIKRIGKFTNVNSPAPSVYSFSQSTPSNSVPSSPVQERRCPIQRMSNFRNVCPHSPAESVYSFPSVTSTPSPARRGASVPANAVTKKAGSVKNPAVKKAPAKTAAKGKAAAKAVTKKAHARRVK
jgi:hypothetical protein